MTRQDDYLWDRSGVPDPGLEHLEELLGRFRYGGSQVSKPDSAWVNILPIAMAAGIVLLMGFLWRPVQNGPNSHWEVLAVAGSPHVASSPINARDSLPVGEWLETDSLSRAQLLVGEFGVIDVGPNTRLRLLAAGDASQRIVLQRGRIDAFIDAPPRLFVVETPSATAVDLGCEYDLTVDGNGAGLLHVTSGWVSFEHDGRAAVVPAGAKCETRPGHGPGTPYCENASDAFREALAHFDFAPQGDRRLSNVIETSGPCDMMALWHLLHRVSAEERTHIYDRMAQMDSPPANVTRDGVRDLDSPMMDVWWDNIKLHRTCLMCGEMQLVPPPAPVPGPS